MNIQDAYKKLDLAKGLNRERVESQYQNLKAELEPKISGTQNERLKQVYTNRLEEIEQAYAVLIAHFEDAAAEVVQKVNPAPEVSDFSPQNVPAQGPKKKTGRIIGIVLLVLAIIAAPLVYFNSDAFAEEEEIDLFRKIEGELQVFVNNLTLRQYPDSKSAKIEVFPMGTRLFYDQNENPKTDDKNRVWRKVRVIHPVYGWERPDERFPYPYEGWMAIEECGISWVADSLKTVNLMGILGNDDAGRYVSSAYRHGLIDFFQRNNYLGEWILYGENKTSKLQNGLLLKLGNSYEDCNGEDQLDFIAAFRNTESQKLVVMSTNSEGDTWVVYEEDFYGENFGMRKLSASELKSFNRAAGANFKNAVYLNRSYGNNILVVQRGEVYTYRWGNIN
jgi:hypothetical protein